MLSAPLTASYWCSSYGWVKGKNGSISAGCRPIVGVVMMMIIIAQVLDEMSIATSHRVYFIRLDDILHDEQQYQPIASAILLIVMA